MVVEPPWSMLIACVQLNTCSRQYSAEGKSQLRTFSQEQCGALINIDACLC
jgi:hypothetical protein